MLLIPFISQKKKHSAVLSIDASLKGKPQEQSGWSERNDFM